MTQLLMFDPESVAATGSTASPLITGLFVYAIATTAYILIGLPDVVSAFRRTREEDERART